MNSRLPSRNRIIWVLLGLLILANFVVLAYIAMRDPGIIVQQFRGEEGKAGQSIQGPEGPPGRTPIKGVDYFDGRDGKDGQSIIGPQGAPGPAGRDGVNGTNGINGTDGAPARNSQFDCQDGDFVTRYEGDDGWRVIQEDSSACQETLL